MDLSVTAQAPATVFVFLSPECPLSQSYTLTLNALHQAFRSRQVLFFAVIPGQDYPLSEVQAFEKQYALTCPVLLDEAYKLTKQLGASVTPEAVVVDRAGKEVYAGKIDNWAYALGRKRKVITERYVYDALTDHLQHKPVAVRKTEPVGCFIFAADHEKGDHEK